MTNGAGLARDHFDAMDSDRPAWSVVCDKSAIQVTKHVRSTEIRHQGRAAELFDVEVAADVTNLQVVNQLPSAALIDDLKLSLWFQSNQDGATLTARVVFPNQIDIETGTTLMVLVEGDTYTKVGQWQKLECRDLDQRLTRMLPKIRRRLQSAGGAADIDVAGRYIDTAVINIRTSRGQSRFAIDELQFGPIVEPQSEGKIRTTPKAEPEVVPDAVFQLERLVVRGQPFFPRFIPYHGEQGGDLARMRLNLTWIPDYQDGTLLAELERMGLRAMAIPPQPAPEPGQEQAGSSNAHLAPFGPETAPILFWYLGTQIQPDAKREITIWQEQVRNSDRAFKRPLMGDVAGLERTYSRQFSMLGVHRAAVHTNFSPRNYRDWLVEHRNLAQPGSFLWTWVQTESPLSVAEARESAGWHPQVVEPEQIRWQVYAALAAGYKGIGFWTHSSLDDDRPGTLERKLAISQLNMELEILEPLLATGSLGGNASFTAQAEALRKPNRVGAMREAELNDRDVQLRRQEQLKTDLEAAVITSAGIGKLVLPVWYADEAQYVPGRMVANDATIVVPGVGESSRAWEITTTRIRELPAERVTGGKQITLKKFDMTAAILFTENPSIVERLRERVNYLSESAARVSVELARAKHERVVAIDLELQKLGRGQNDSARILEASRNCLDRAETFRKAQQFHDARLQAADAQQYLRILQYIHWSDAAHRLDAPVSSPHTLCFQTLPDHWNMIARFGRTLNSEAKNVLRSGDCEDFPTMVAEGWTRSETAIDGVRAVAELLPAGAHKGTYSLRLVAAPAAGREPPISIPQRTETVVTPPVTVYKGQLVFIRGWVKVAAPSIGNLDGSMFYDSLGGPTAALRWRNVSDWKKFEVIREVTATSELTLTMALSGLGDIRFDDLEIILLDVDSSPGKMTGKNAVPVGRTGRGGPWDFLKRLPGVGGKTDSN